MAISCFPSAAFKMIWARWAKRTEAEVLRATLSNSACCAGKRQISGATLMPGRLMVANRSVKQYVILFTTHYTRLIKLASYVVGDSTEVSTFCKCFHFRQ